MIAIRQSRFSVGGSGFLPASVSMMRHSARETLAAACIALTLCVRANAQAPDGAAKMSAAAVAESLSVLRQLDSVVHTNPDDAATWYRRGMLAWALYERDRTKPPIAGLDWTLLGHMADTSLRLAALIDPQNAHYRMMAGRFLLNSGVSITRVASYGFFGAALEAARQGDDPYVHAETAIEAGRVHWRRYDTFANRWMDLGVGDCGLATQTNAALLAARGDSGRRDGAKLIADLVRQCRKPISSSAGFSGEADYLEAEALFREAFDAQPSFERAYRQLAMLLVERFRWRELEVTARTRIGAAPWDAWAWLTLGLALHRQGGHAKVVAVAFDSAFALLPREEVRRLDHLERVLRPKDTARTNAMDSVAHAAMQRLYWMSADPLWSREGNEPHVEFLARVTHAELRWTVEEMKVRGADSDRGDVHIRYGPPDLIVASKGNGGGPPDIETDWFYNTGLFFQFVGQPTFATARIPPGGEQSFGDLTAGTPVHWDNIHTIAVDTMPVQAARFRAATDSVDLYLVTLPPVAQIAKVAEVKGSVRSDVWILAGGLVPIVHDSANADAPGIRVYQRRIAAGTYVYRAEASADGARYAARATAAFVAGPDSATGFSTRGFGMSDVLLAATASSRGTPLRWSDLDILPLVGTVVRKGQIALVWENYELGNDGGTARYTVSVTIERQRSVLGRIATQFIGRVGTAAGIDRSENRVTLHFERNVPYAPALLDNVTLGLGSTPAGSYRLTIGVADRVSGRATSRSMNLTVQER